MAGSALFERACEELERSTHLSRMEARGTLRIALKEAGFEAGSINRPQMLAVIFHSLPQELAARGLGAEAHEICDGIASRLATS